MNLVMTRKFTFEEIIGLNDLILSIEKYYPTGFVGVNSDKQLNLLKFKKKKKYIEGL